MDLDFFLGKLDSHFLPMAFILSKHNEMGIGLWFFLALRINLCQVYETLMELIYLVIVVPLVFCGLSVVQGGVR